MRDGWRRVPLGELADLSIGGTPSRFDDSLWADGQQGLPWAAISDLSGKYLSRTSETITSLGVRMRRLRLVQPGTPVMSFKLSIGRASIASVPLYTNEAIVALNAKPGISHPLWLYYAVPMAAKGAISEAAIKGGTLNLKSLSALLVPAPSFESQQYSAGILEAIDEQIISSTEASRKLYHTMSAAVQQRLTSLIQSAELSRPLEEFGDVVGGVTLGFEPEGGSSVELPYLRVANVQDGYIDTSEMKTVRIRQSDVDRFALAVGDVLLTEGGDLDKLGRGAVWDGRIDPCLHQNHVFRVRCRQDKLLAGFLGELLGSDYGKRYFLGVAKQTTNLASINSTQVKAMPIPMLPISDQEQFVCEVREWRKRLAVELAAIAKIETLKKALMAELLTDRAPIYSSI